MKIPQLTLIATLALTTVVLAQEKKIQRADLPPVVEKALAEQSQGATIKGFSLEKENGQTYYEAEMTVNDHSKDVTVDGAGTVVEIEEQVSLDSIPSAVKDGLQAKAGAGKILKVESLTKHDKIVAYEAKVLTGARKSEIQVGPDGNALDHEE